MFGDDDFGFAWSIFGVIGIWSVQEHDHVGVLFDGTAFAEVCEAWSFVFAQFDSAIQLCECHNGDSQFLCEEFESSGDAGDLLFAGGVFVFRFDQLQVVDDDDAEGRSAVQTSSERGDLGHGASGFVIDEQGQSCEVVRGFDELHVLIFAEVSGAEVMAVDFGGDGEEAFGQFEVGLFETEEQYAFAGLAGHGFCDVTDEGCFAHGGASSEDDEFCGLEPGGLFIEVSEAGGDSGDVSGFAKSFIDAIEGIHEDIADGDAGGAALFLDNTEDSPFGTLQQRFHVIGGIVAVGEDFGAGVDQTALHPLVANDIGVVANVCGVWNGFKDFCEVCGATDGFEFTATDQFFGECDGVDAADAGFIQFMYGGIDFLVCIAVEVFGLQ